MTTTLVFIHGTGVRKEGYEQTFAKLVDGLDHAGRGDIKVKGVLWGDTLGVNFTDAEIAAVLPPAAVMAVGAVPTDWETFLWEQLLIDPLYELRLAAIRQLGAVVSGAPLPGAVHPEIIMSTRVATLPQRLAEPLPGGVTIVAIGEAAVKIAATPELTQAVLAAPGAGDIDLNYAVARAVVAEALVRSRGGVGEGPDALYVLSDRQALVELIVPQLIPVMGLKGWLLDKAKGIAEAIATHYGVKRRDGLLVGGGPVIGDILLYQRRGDTILDTIENTILESANDGEVIALGHSLGGIMLVDLLSRPRAAGKLPVRKLITVGSQSPAFYACDSLGTIRKGAALPPGAPFLPWLNVFDRNDFLSFCASRCFPGMPAGIADFEIKSGVSFPEAHSAYFRQDAFYRRLVQFLAP